MKAELIEFMGDDLRVAYLAGLTDADGCLSINKVDEGRYAPCLSFVNTSPKLIKLFHKEFGGKVYTKKKISDNHETVYEVQVRNSGQLASALNKLIPFLLYKKKKAELVEEYVWSILNNGNKKLSQTTIDIRFDIIQRWKHLNEV